MKSKAFKADNIIKLNDDINLFLEENQIANIITLSHDCAILKTQKDYIQGNKDLVVTMTWIYTALMVYQPLAEHRDNQINEILK